MKKTGVAFSFTFLALALSSCGGGVSSSDSIISSSSSIDSATSSISSEDKDLLPLNTETDCYSHSFASLGNDVMPITGWCSPIGELITNDQYKLLAESGLNSIYGLYEQYTNNKSDVDKSFTYSKENGIAYLPRDTSFGALIEEEELLKERIAYYENHDNYEGILITDEFGAKAFSGIAKIVKKLRSLSPRTLAYVNLFPNYASQGQLENGGSGGETTMGLDYETYVDKFLATVSPDVLSYDYYPFGHTGDGLEGYFDQLYVAAEAANKYKIPFWPFIQACNFGGDSIVPNQQQLDWQVSTSLLYGAKGIQYFCYSKPLEFGAFDGCFVDKNGGKTAIYDYGKAANEQISRMDEVLMSSTLVNKIKVGETPAPFLAKEEFVTSSRELEAVSSNGNFLVGTFDRGGKSSFLVVNNSMEDSNVATLSFKSKIKANLIERKATTSVEGTSLEISLLPGQSALVELTNYRQERI